MLKDYVWRSPWPLLDFARSAPVSSQGSHESWCYFSSKIIFFEKATIKFMACLQKNGSLRIIQINHFAHLPRKLKYRVFHPQPRVCHTAIQDFAKPQAKSLPNRKPRHLFQQDMNERCVLCGRKLNPSPNLKSTEAILCTEMHCMRMVVLPKMR